MCSVTQSCLTICDSMDCSPPGSSVHGDSPWQEYWSGLPCPPPGISRGSIPGIEPTSPALQEDSLTAKLPGKPSYQGSSKLLSHVRFFVTPWNSPGKNTRVGCHASSRGSAQPRNQTGVSSIAGGFFTSCTTREASFGRVEASFQENAS